MYRSLQKYGFWLCLLPALAPSLSWAYPAPSSTLDIKFWVGSDMAEWTPTMISSGNVYTINDVTNTLDGSSVAWHNLALNYDPFISASVDVVNNTASVQTYTLIFTMPISPAITSGSRIGGSVQGGLTDANFDGIGTLSTVGPGTALYFGEIDGADVLPLFPDLNTMNVPFAGGSTNESASAGLPGPTIPGPNALTSIGIKHQFSLTPGDRATFTSFFVVNPVPEPASVSLLAIGALMLIRRRRS